MAGRQQVRVMGVEPHSVDETYQLIRIAESVGMDAMQLYCLDLGHGNQPMPAELELFFRTNLERMSIPAVLSTHFMLGYMIPIDMLGRLIDDYPHIIGVNCTTRDLDYLDAVLELADGRVDVHVGGPQLALAVLDRGGQGFLCTEAILAPKSCGSVIRHHLDHDDAAPRSPPTTGSCACPPSTGGRAQPPVHQVGAARPRPAWMAPPPSVPATRRGCTRADRQWSGELRIAETEGLEPTQEP